MATTVSGSTLRTPGSTSPRYTPAWARYVNAAAGVWLFIAGFLWDRSQADRANAWIVGVAICVVALVALRNELARYINSALAVWLLLSAVGVFRPGTVPLWNDVIVAIVVFALSLVPNSSTTPRGVLPPTPHPPGI